MSEFCHLIAIACLVLHVGCAGLASDSLPDDTSPVNAHGRLDTGTDPDDGAACAVGRRTDRTVRYSGLLQIVLPTLGGGRCVNRRLEAENDPTQDGNDEEHKKRPDDEKPTRVHTVISGFR